MSTRKRKQQADGDEEEPLTLSRTASKSKLVGRRLVSAQRERKEESGGLTKVLEREYRRALCHLNQDFAAWYAEQEAKYYASQDDGEEPTFFYQAAWDYLRRASALQDRYLFPVGGGDVLVCGMGDCGQLGLTSSVMEVKMPRVVKNLKTSQIGRVACGGLHVVALGSEGGGQVVYTWGCNDDGALGRIQEEATSWFPQPVTGFVPSSNDGGRNSNKAQQDEVIVAIAAGDCQTLCLSLSGNVYMFGCYKDKEGKAFRDFKPSNDTRQDPKDGENDMAPYPWGKQFFPIHVLRNAKHIECGECFNAAILEDDSLVTWGLGEMGAMGRPVPPMKDARTGEYDLDAIAKHYLTPLPPVWAVLPNIQREVVAVGCGGYHILVVAKEGPNLKLYTSGLNNYGQLGHGDLKHRDQLTQVEALADVDICKVDGGQHFSMCCDISGQYLYTFGRGDSGQLGVTDELPSPGYGETLPVSVLLEPSEEQQPSVKQFSCGGQHSLAMTDDGAVYTWGYGDMDALGHGSQKDEFRPRKLDVMADVKKREMNCTTGTVRHVASGGQNSAMVVTRGGGLN